MLDLPNGIIGGRVTTGRENHKGCGMLFEDEFDETIKRSEGENRPTLGETQHLRLA
jgi:hypothetical protein